MTKFKKNNSGNIVYSTNKDFTENQEDDSFDTPSPSSQMLKVWLEKNSRGGKTASVIRDFIGKEEDLNDLARILKTKCGVGGSVKDGEIIIQGDHREKIIKILTELGYKSKKAGG